MRWINPWADDSGFVFLETMNHRISRSDGFITQTIDLYAIEAPEKVHFGARFSDDGPDYESGSWQRNSDRLYLRGYIGIRALGRSQTWRRAAASNCAS